MTERACDSKTPGLRLRGVDACRGIAALLVALFHTEITVAKPKYLDTDPFGGAFLFGCRGVDFFFVLSGFIITYAHWNDLGHVERVPEYFKKRLMRVFPLLWVVAIPFFWASVVMRSDYVPKSTNAIAECLLSTLFLLPSSITPVPSVVWTLKHEMFFYLLFAFAIWKPRAAVIGAFVWVGCILAQFRGPFDDSPAMALVLSYYNIEFLMGIVCAIILRRWTVPMPLLLCALGTLAFVGFGVQFNLSGGKEGNSLFDVLSFGAASLLLVIGVGQLDLLQKTQWLPRVCNVLGEASYAIYLVHFPVISLTSKIGTKILTRVELPAIVIALMIFLASVIAGVCLHFAIEKPLMEMIRGRLRRQTPLVPIGPIPIGGRMSQQA